MRMAFYNGLKLGEQCRGRPGSRFKAKEAIDRTLESVRRFLVQFGSGAGAGTDRAHGILEWPEKWRTDSGQACELFASKRSDRSHTLKCQKAISFPEPS